MKVEKNSLEWIVFGVSLLLVLGVLGLLGYWAATSGDAPPRIVLELGDVEKRGEQFTVPVTALNHGDQTAEGVQISVELVRGDERESAEFEFQFLPHNSRREGAAVFQSDPATADSLEARVLGYRVP